MARIFLVRHGQTAWNREKIFRGRTDLPLAEFGIKQAEAIGAYLADQEVERIFSSPMLRAVQTAEPLARLLGLGIETAPDLVDADFGEWQGLSIPQVEERFPDLFALWQTEPHRVAFPGGETYLQVAERAARAFREIAREAGGATVVVVGHRFVNKVILCSLLGIVESGFWKIKQDTACINAIEMGGGAAVVVESLNDTSHLRGLQAPREIDF